MNIKSPQMEHKRVRTKVICPYCRREYWHMGRVDRARRVFCEICARSPDIDWCSETYSLSGRPRKRNHE